MARLRGRAPIVLSVAAMLAAAGLAHGQGGLTRLRERYPEVSAIEEEGRVRAVYGRPMTTAATPEEAAARFLADHGEVFSPTAMSLDRFFVIRTRDGRKTTYWYTQRIGNVPVEPSHGRIMMLETAAGGPYAVVYASFDVAAPAAPLPPTTLTSEQALAFAQAHPRAVGLVNWSAPERAVSWDRSSGQSAAVHAWKVVGSGRDPIGSSLTFFVNGRSGEIIRVRDEIAFAHRDVPVSGTVTGFATPGFRPDTFPWGCSPNGPVSVVLPNVFVEVTQGPQRIRYSSMYADSQGQYSLMAPSTGNVFVRLWLSGPTWALADFQGTTNGPLPVPPNPPTSCFFYAPPIFEAPLAPTVNFTVNPSPFAEHQTALVNAARHIEAAHGLFYNRLDPTVFTGLNACARLQVNYTTFSCGGGYDPPSSTVLVGVVTATPPPHPTPGCPNTAYSTMLAHEYGHFIMHRVFGKHPGDHCKFHEGYGDSLALLMFDTPIFAIEVSGCPGGVPTFFRNTETANYQYGNPCETGCHSPGQLLSGVWWDIRNNLGAGPSGLAAAQTLFVHWSALATGEQPPPGLPLCQHPQSAGPATWAEVLTADDNDGTLSNGTPNFNAICLAFTAHNIPRPAGVPSCTDAWGVTPKSCAADCDNRNGRGVLDVFDFMCFQKRFVARDAWACNFDTTDGESVCDVFDFLAFQTAFAEGCP